jgi:hypothetical protein
MGTMSEEQPNRFHAICRLTDYSKPYPSKYAAQLVSEVRLIVDYQYPHVFQSHLTLSGVLDDKTASPALQLKVA